MHEGNRISQALPCRRSADPERDVADIDDIHVEERLTRSRARASGVHWSTNCCCHSSKVSKAQIRGAWSARPFLFSLNQLRTSTGLSRPLVFMFARERTSSIIALRSPTSHERTGAPKPAFASR
jgi:hypothetical protein